MRRLSTGTPFWRDQRFWRIFSQALFVALVALAGWYAAHNMTVNLAKLGSQIGFDFLSIEAGFGIGESSIPYDPSNTFAYAFLVGVINTLRIAVIGVVLATLLGVVVGLSRLSTNWLVNKIAFGYVEVLRNTPVLLQILFWYFAVFLNVPRIADKITLPGPIYLSNRGLVLPWFERGPSFTLFLIAVLIGAVGAFLLFRRRLQTQVESGTKTYPGPVGLLFLLGVALLAWLALPGDQLTYTAPLAEGNNITGGAQLTPEFAAVLAGLVVYTSAFIGEIVRSGIQAVSKGQVEAARALGLRPTQVLRLVVLPQALRVIIPPLTSQYLNLTKNSSLAIAVGYPDLFSIATTVMNQTGRTIEMISIIMAVYLFFSLSTSVLMNWYNRSVRLIER